MNWRLRFSSPESKETCLTHRLDKVSDDISNMIVDGSFVTIPTEPWHVRLLVFFRLIGIGPSTRRETGQGLGASNIQEVNNAGVGI